MKKIFLRIILIALMLIILSKVYESIIINKMYHAIEKFKNENNKYCAVSIKEKNTERKEELFVKDRICKYCQNKENTTYLEWKDFDRNEQYGIDIGRKECYKNTISLYLETDLLHMPRLMLSMDKKHTLNFKTIFDIYCIIPIKYNDKFCCKIITKEEIIIIDKETYLPLYSSNKLVNTENNYKIEYSYEFDVGNVTDEDIALPDLKEYTIID